LHLSPGRKVSFTHPRVGCHLAVRVLPIWITRECHMKPSGPNLYLGVVISLCLVLWRGTCPCWLSPTHGDPDCTQILTRHCGALSQTVSQLMNTRIAPTRQVLIVHTLLVIETPTDGVRTRVAHHSDNPDGSGGFISRQRQSKQYTWKLAFA
jgi:hypothetical protein